MAKAVGIGPQGCRTTPSVAAFPGSAIQTVTFDAVDRDVTSEAPVVAAA